MADSADASHPAVQAILTADTLLRHYSQAADMVRSLVNRDTQEMNVHIGDANHTYASIWEHLDDARRILAAEGHDVASYDDLRATSRRAGPVGVDTDRREVEVGYGLRTDVRQTITVHFNVAGIDLAHRASSALKMSAPEIPWPALMQQAAAPVARITSSPAKVWILLGAILAAAFAALYLFGRGGD